MAFGKQPRTVTRDLAVSRAVGGAGCINGALSAVQATVGCCCLCCGQKAGGQIVQDSSWCVRGVDTEMVRDDMVVQVMGWRKCLVLPLACITLCEPGTCPNV